MWIQGTHESTVSTIFIFSRNAMNAFTVIQQCLINRNISLRNNISSKSRYFAELSKARLPSCSIVLVTCGALLSSSIFQLLAILCTGGLVKLAHLLHLVEERTSLTPHQQRRMKGTVGTLSKKKEERRLQDIVLLEY